MVIDASAVLALLFAEPGAGVVRAQLRAGVIGTANLVEVLSKLSDKGMSAAQATRAVELLGLEVVPMTEAQARRAAVLRSATRSACLALAAELGVPALTADRGWIAVAAAVGVDVQVIR